MSQRIVLNTISYHGKGAINDIVPELTGRGFRKAFVCSDPDLIQFGVTKKVTDLLDQAGFKYAIFSDIKPNPSIENVQAGVTAFQTSGAVFCPGLIQVAGICSVEEGRMVLDCTCPPPAPTATPSPRRCAR